MPRKIFCKDSGRFERLFFALSDKSRQKPKDAVKGNNSPFFIYFFAENLKYGNTKDFQNGKMIFKQSVNFS